MHVFFMLSWCTYYRDTVWLYTTKSLPSGNHTEEKELLSLFPETFLHPIPVHPVLLSTDPTFHHELLFWASRNLLPSLYFPEISLNPAQLSTELPLWLRFVSHISLHPALLSRVCFFLFYRPWWEAWIRSALRLPQLNSSLQCHLSRESLIFNETTSLVCNFKISG